MVVIIVPLAVIAAIFLLSRLATTESGLSHKDRLASLAKYIVVTAIATYGSIALAALFASPALVYGKVFHSGAGDQIFSALLDRPYFPLQSAVAFALGSLLAGRLRDGKPLWVWVWPVLQVVIAIALHGKKTVFESFPGSVWRSYFDWGCGCSITLLQWEVMSPLYPALAFTLGALIRYRQHQRTGDATVLRSASTSR